MNTEAVRPTFDHWEGDVQQYQQRQPPHNDDAVAPKKEMESGPTTTTIPSKTGLRLAVEAMLCDRDHRNQRVTNDFLTNFNDPLNENTGNAVILAHLTTLHYEGIESEWRRTVPSDPGCAEKDLVRLLKPYLIELHLFDANGKRTSEKRSLTREQLENQDMKRPVRLIRSKRNLKEGSGSSSPNSYSGRSRSSSAWKSYGDEDNREDSDEEEVEDRKVGIASPFFAPSVAATGGRKSTVRVSFSSPFAETTAFPANEDAEVPFQQQQQQSHVGEVEVESEGPSSPTLVALRRRVSAQAGVNEEALRQHQRQLSALRRLSQPKPTILGTRLDDDSSSEDGHGDDDKDNQAKRKKRRSFVSSDLELYVADLFLSIDTDRDRRISWEDFVTYVIERVFGHSLGDDNASGTTTTGGGGGTASSIHGGATAGSPLLRFDSSVESSQAGGSLLFKGLFELKEPMYQQHWVNSVNYFTGWDAVVSLNRNVAAVHMVEDMRNAHKGSRGDRVTAYLRHEGPVRNCEYIATQGLFVTTAAEKKTLRLWSVHLRKELRPLKHCAVRTPHEASITCIRAWERNLMTDDHTMLLVGTRTGHVLSLLMEEADNAKKTAKSRPIPVHATYAFHSDAVNDMLVLPRTGRVVSAGMDGKIYSHLINSEAGDVHRTRLEYAGHKKGIVSMTYCSGYEVFVSCGIEFEALAWAENLPSSPAFPLKDNVAPHTAPLCRVMAVPGTPQVYTVDVSGHVKLFDIRTLSVIGCWNAFDKSRVPIEVVFDVHSGGQRGTTHLGCIGGVCYTGSTNRSIIFGAKNLYKFHTETRSFDAERAHDVSEGIVGLDFSASHYVTATRSVARIWSSADGAPKATYSTKRYTESPVTSIALDMSSNKIITGHREGILTAFAADTGILLRQYICQFSAVRNIAVDPIAGLIIATFRNGETSFWIDLDPGFSPKGPAAHIEAAKPRGALNYKLPQPYHRALLPLRCKCPQQGVFFHRSSSLDRRASLLARWVLRKWRASSKTINAISESGTVPGRCIAKIYTAYSVKELRVSPETMTCCALSSKSTCRLIDYSRGVPEVTHRLMHGSERILTAVSYWAERNIVVTADTLGMMFLWLAPQQMPPVMLSAWVNRCSLSSYAPSKSKALEKDEKNNDEDDDDDEEPMQHEKVELDDYDDEGCAMEHLASLSSIASVRRLRAQTVFMDDKGRQELAISLSNEEETKRMKEKQMAEQKRRLMDSLKTRNKTKKGGILKSLDDEEENGNGGQKTTVTEAKKNSVGATATDKKHNRQQQQQQGGGKKRASFTVPVVSSLLIEPGRGYIVSGDDVGFMHLWELDTVFTGYCDPSDPILNVMPSGVPPRWIFSWLAHQQAVSSIRVFPNSYAFITSSIENIVSIWDVSGELQSGLRQGPIVNRKWPFPTSDLRARLAIVSLRWRKVQNVIISGEFSKMFCSSSSFSSFCSPKEGPRQLTLPSLRRQQSSTIGQIGAKPQREKKQADVMIVHPRLDAWLCDHHPKYSTMSEQSKQQQQRATVSHRPALSPNSLASIDFPDATFGAQTQSTGARSRAASSSATTFAFPATTTATTTVRFSIADQDTTTANEFERGNESSDVTRRRRSTVSSNDSQGQQQRDDSDNGNGNEQGEGDALDEIPSVLVGDMQAAPRREPQFRARFTAQGLDDVVVLAQQRQVGVRQGGAKKERTGDGNISASSSSGGSRASNSDEFGEISDAKRERRRRRRMAHKFRFVVPEGVLLDAHGNPIEEERKIEEENLGRQGSSAGTTTAVAQQLKVQEKEVEEEATASKPSRFDRNFIRMEDRRTLTVIEHRESLGLPGVISSSSDEGEEVEGEEGKHTSSDTKRKKKKKKGDPYKLVGPKIGNLYYETIDRHGNVQRHLQSSIDPVLQERMRRRPPGYAVCGDVSSSGHTIHIAKFVPQDRNQQQQQQQQQYQVNQAPEERSSIIVAAEQQQILRQFVPEDNGYVRLSAKSGTTNEVVAHSKVTSLEDETISNQQQQQQQQLTWQSVLASSSASPTALSSAMTSHEQLLQRQQQERLLCRQRHLQQRQTTTIATRRNSSAGKVLLSPLASRASTPGTATSTSNRSNARAATVGGAAPTASRPQATQPEMEKERKITAPDNYPTTTTRSAVSTKKDTPMNNHRIKSGNHEGSASTHKISEATPNGAGVVAGLREVVSPWDTATDLTSNKSKGNKVGGGMMQKKKNTNTNPTHHFPFDKGVHNKRSVDIEATSSLAPPHRRKLMKGPTTTATAQATAAMPLVTPSQSAVREASVTSASPELLLGITGVNSTTPTSKNKVDQREQQQQQTSTGSSRPASAQLVETLLEQSK